MNKIKAACAALVLTAMPSASLAADALSAFSNGAPTAPFGFGGYNAGPASFSAATDCFGVSGFECRQNSQFGFPAIGKVSAAIDIGAATLDPAYLSLLPFSSGGPSVAIFYRHDGVSAVRLRASYKLLGDAQLEPLNVSIFREVFQVVFPGPVGLTGVTASAANSSGVFDFVVEQAGTYGVHVTRTSDLPFPAPSATSRGDWIGLNLEALPAVTPVPEPASWTLMVIGFGSLGAALRRRPTALLA